VGFNKQHRLDDGAGRRVVQVMPDFGHGEPVVGGVVGEDAEGQQDLPVGVVEGGGVGVDRVVDLIAAVVVGGRPVLLRDPRNGVLLPRSGLSDSGTGLRRPDRTRRDRCIKYTRGAEPAVEANGPSLSSADLCGVGII
jgi:hypothetical protein